MNNNHGNIKVYKTAFLPRKTQKNYFYINLKSFLEKAIEELQSQIHIQMKEIILIQPIRMTINSHFLACFWVKSS